MIYTNIAIGVLCFVVGFLLGFWFCAILQRERRRAARGYYRKGRRGA